MVYIKPSTYLRKIFEAANEGEDKKEVEKALKKEDDKKEAIKEKKDVEIDATSEKSINDNKYSFKAILALYDISLGKIKQMGPSGPPLDMIYASGGDITKLGQNHEYYDMLKGVIAVHAEIIKALTQKNSKYMQIYKHLFTYVEKNAPAYKKAFAKGPTTLVASLYTISIILLFECATIISACTIHIMNKNAVDFDKLLEQTKEYVSIFNHAESLYDSDDLNNADLIKQENKIKENSEFELNLAEIDNDIVEAFINFNKKRNAPKEDTSFTIARISKLINFGLAVTLYKMFNIVRLMIYAFQWSRFSFANKIDMINKSLSMQEEVDGAKRTSMNQQMTAKSIEYRSDTIESMNKADVQISKEALNF